jgi:hypothetical protein
MLNFNLHIFCRILSSRCHVHLLRKDDYHTFVVCLFVCERLEVVKVLARLLQKFLMGFYTGEGSIFQPSRKVLALPIL